MFTSSGQFLTPQLLFGNSCREWRRRETWRTCCRRLKCYMFLLFENVSEQSRALSTEQAHARFHGYRPGTEWRLGTGGEFSYTTHWCWRKSTCSLSSHKASSWNNFVISHYTLSWGIKSNSNAPPPSFHMWCSIWPWPLMNAASCHLLMELPSSWSSVLWHRLCVTAVAKRLLDRLKDRINQRLHMTGSQAPRSHIR